VLPMGYFLYLVKLSTATTWQSNSAHGQNPKVFLAWSDPSWST